MRHLDFVIFDISQSDIVPFVINRVRYISLCQTIESDLFPFLKVCKGKISELMACKGKISELMACDGKISELIV